MHRCLFIDKYSLNGFNGWETIEEFDGWLLDSWSLNWIKHKYNILVEICWYFFNFIVICGNGEGILILE